LKKLLFISLLFFSLFLFGNDTLDDFINQQIKVEKQLIDNNISLKEKIKIKHAQERSYQDLFLGYSANKSDFLASPNPYKHAIYKLKLQYNSNKRNGNKTASLRDELLLHNYKFRNSMRKVLKEALRFTDSQSKAFYKDKIDELLVKQFTNYHPIEKKKYISNENNITTHLQQELLDAYNQVRYLEFIANTFSSELVENSSFIYRTASLSTSKIFTFVNKINKSKFGRTLNIYLDTISLNTAQVTLVLMIIVFIILIQKIIYFISDLFLHQRKIREDDIEYIHTHITNIFNYLTSLIIIHLIIVVVLGVDVTSVNISKVFAILYIILIALILYRVTNTIAFMKMERMKRSAVLRNEVINLSIKVINGVIILISIIAMLKVIGVDLTAVLSGLGIAGAAVAFAAKDSIANIFGSVSILAGDIFEQGDWIQSNHAEGTVVEIGLRATTIRTFDNALISVPNFELSNSSVKNWTRRRIGRRIKMNIGVTYESDFNDIKQAIKEIKEMLRNHPGIANEHTSFSNSDRHAKLVSIEDLKGIKRTTLVYMDEFAASSINILLYCFSRTVIWNEWLEVKEDVMFKIADILKKNNLEFAYPTMTIYQAEQNEE
jgi:MscS family membrane protein